MASTLFFVVMIIITGILLLIASFAATFAAADVFGSSFYNTNSNFRNAHQYLTIAAALGWSSIVVLIVILIVAAVAGGFTYKEISEAFLNNSTPTIFDMTAAVKQEQALSSGHTVQIFVLIVLVIIAIITLIVGILAISASISLSNGIPLGSDNKANNAYSLSILAAVSGVGGVGVIIAAIIAYVAIRSARAKELKVLEQYIAAHPTHIDIVPDRHSRVDPHSPIYVQGHGHTHSTRASAPVIMSNRSTPVTPIPVTPVPVTTAPVTTVPVTTVHVDPHTGDHIYVDTHTDEHVHADPHMDEHVTVMTDPHSSSNLQYRQAHYS